ncbi:uroporphyrinogen-III synthase, partial [Pseudomonas viridiflava]|uniref:uroporphyrinogen-III synthase n=1 Tax=Pseudomonas viridiflava TaxID=33069 RepID=UPI001981ADF9
LLERYWPQPPAHIAWFTVGAATGRILADHGLAVNYPAQGDDSEALLALPQLHTALAATATPRVLILRGEGGREALAECLRGQGVAVDYLPLYRRSL